MHLFLYFLFCVTLSGKTAELIYRQNGAQNACLVCLEKYVQFFQFLSPIKFNRYFDSGLSVGGRCTEMEKLFDILRQTCLDLTTFISSLVKFRRATPEKRSVTLPLFCHIGAVPMARKALNIVDFFYSSE